MTSRNDAIESIGELLLTGFQGLELSDESAAFISQSKLGGVILFGHNYENPAQVAELTNQIHELAGSLPLWVSVDQEGGKVQRFKKGFCKIPPAGSIGATNSPKLTFEIAEVIAQELKAVGINLNFCPVADIHTNPKNPVIGNRSFGETEELVSKMVTAMVRGHLVHGVQPCVKHFPGHGDTSVDSHFDLPRVDTSLETLEERELKPFLKAFKSKCGMVMSSHVICSQLDSEFPATLSQKILEEFLRKKLRYSGVIVSDDMEMKAVTDHFGAKEAPVMAIQAGCNMLIYRTEAAARTAYEALVKAVENGGLAPEKVLSSVEKTRNLKKSLPPYQSISPADVSKKLALPEYQKLIDQIQSN